MPLGDKYTHESYGMIGISHASCSSGVALFGSSIKHDRMVQIRISRAAVERDLHREWYYSRDSIVEVDMSASQFAEFITTPNVGSGVPCTIRYVDGVNIEEPPYRGHNEMFNEELKKDFINTMDNADDLVNEARELLEKKGPIKAAEKKELLSKIDMLVQHIRSNIPFLHKQFTRSMDKTVTAAKAEIELFYSNMVTKMGKQAIEELNKPDIKVIESDND